MSATIGKHWRVTCPGLQPRYFLTPLDAHRYAETRRHLHPRIWWRDIHPNHATGPWMELEDQGATA